MGELRRHDGSAAVEALGEDLAVIRAALLEAHAAPSQIETCLDDLAEGELVDWVAVAVHRQADGTTKTSIHSHPERTSLQVKGLLHDAVWTAAHHQG